MVTRYYLHGDVLLRVSAPLSPWIGVRSPRYAVNIAGVGQVLR